MAVLECIFKNGAGFLDARSRILHPMGRPPSFDREQVLDRIVTVFWRHGYERTTFAELHRASALQPGSLYAAFGDKEELFSAALERYIATISSAGLARIDAAAHGKDGIRSYFAFLIDAMVDGRRRSGCLITNSLVERHAADKTVAPLVRRHFAGLEATFTRALLRDGYVADDAASRATALTCFVQGLNVIAKTRPGREKLEALVAVTLSSLVP